MGTGHEDQEGQHGEFRQASMGLGRVVDKHSPVLWQFDYSIAIGIGYKWLDPKLDLAVNSIQTTSRRSCTSLDFTFGAFSFGHVVSQAGTRCIDNHHILLPPATTITVPATSYLYDPYA